jgi:ectoine hydroxylase-related dioxygenase (phytanoyl-CoA dioxygenase family)
MGFTETGYAIEANVFTDAECDAILSNLASTIKRPGRAGTRHLLSNTAVATLARDSRLLAIAQANLGGPAIPFRATLLSKSADSNWLIAWHQDTALPLESRFEDSEWGPWTQKAGISYAHAPTWALSSILALRVHLDESNDRNGPLRAVPGSAAVGVMADDRVLEYAKAHTHVECLVPRGGVLAMRPLLIHASSKAQTDEPRRVLHIEYAMSLDLGTGIRSALA